MFLKIGCGLEDLRSCHGPLGGVSPDLLKLIARVAQGPVPLQERAGLGRLLESAGMGENQVVGGPILAQRDSLRGIFLPANNRRADDHQDTHEKNGKLGSMIILGSHSSFLNLGWRDTFPIVAHPHEIRILSTCH